MKEIYYDELTGSYNRRFLRYWLNNEIKRANRFGTKFSLILLDLDDFRNINNNFGHLEGDRVLIAFSNFLRDNIREVDNLVRYGGDEFIILMPNTDENGAIELAQRIIANLNNIKIEHHSLHCSIGFSIFPKDGTTPELLINQADNLMYQAKKQGKNRIGLRLEAIKKLQIPSALTIGRDDETNWCFSQLKEYNTLFITGNAGIGKTRIVLEINKRLKNSIILRGNAYAAMSSVPYHPFKNLFNELVSTNFNLTQNVFKQLPEIYQLELIKIFPAESIIKAVPGEGLDKFRLFNAVLAFLNNIAQLFPAEITILLLDDLHWIDRSSCELLDFLMRGIHNNIKIFGTYRNEELKHSHLADFLTLWSREKLFSQIVLTPLNEKQSAQLIKSICGLISKSAVKYIYKQSGGNPFYIEEIMRELERQKKLYWSGDEWHFSKVSETLIPSTIEDIIKRKLNFIDPEIKTFLEIAAVFGQEFNAKVIALASKRNVGQILDAIDLLKKIGFIKERTQERFFFSEDVVRQVVYKNISRSNLIKYHKVIGETIEIFYHNILPNFYEQLAHHFTTAGDVNKTIYYSKKAAAKAKDNYAHRVAINFFENVLKYEDNIEEIFNIKYDLANIYFLTGDYKKAVEQLNICLKINPNDYKIYADLGKTYEGMGDYKQSLKYYNLGLKLTAGSETMCGFETKIARLKTNLGDYVDAKKICEKLLKKKKLISKKILGEIYITFGVIAMWSGHFKKAETYLKKSLNIAKTSGDKKRLAACYLDLGLNQAGRFNMTLAEKFYNKALKIYQEIGYQEGLLITMNNLGALYGYFDIPKAEGFYLKALKQAKLIGAKRTLIYLYNNLGAIEFNRLMLDQALLNYREAIKIAKEIHFPIGMVFSNLSLSEYYREKDNIKRGQSYLKNAMTTVKKSNMKYLYTDCLKEEIEYLLLSRKIKKADLVAKQLSALLKKEMGINAKINALLYNGRIASEKKDAAKAEKYFKKALTYVKHLPANRISGEILYRRAINLKKAGRFKEALKHFIQANKIFTAIGNLRFIDKIEFEIANINI